MMHIRPCIERKKVAILMTFYQIAERSVPLITRYFTMTCVEEYTVELELGTPQLRTVQLSELQFKIKYH